MGQPTKKDKLLDLTLHVQACSHCPYARTRDQPLVGDGEYRSPVLIIGDKPRKTDDEKGEVFAGRAGKKLSRMLERAELKIDKTYRTYAIRCFPGREPSFGEFSAFKRCQDHTVDLLKLMRPIAVVICGYKLFKWMLLRWTSEVVDEHNYYKWVGKAVRLKEVWGDLKFFIIESPSELSKKSNRELELKSVELLREMKTYVLAQQKKEPVALEMVELKRRPHVRTVQQTFGWS